MIDNIIIPLVYIFVHSIQYANWILTIFYLVLCVILNNSINAKVINL